MSESTCLTCEGNQYQGT